MKMKSDVIYGILTDEYRRNLRICDRYQKEIDVLPKGSLLIREISGKTYVYLKYRQDGHVVSEYRGAVETVDINSLKEQIAKRKELEKVIKRLKQEQKDLLKVIKVD